MSNPYFDLLEDALIEHLECETCYLPQQFSVVVEDEDFQKIIASGFVYKNGVRVPLTVKHLTLNLLGRSVTIKSDKDPEDWAIMLRSEALH